MPVGSRVYVTHESPFKGCKGTILAIHMMATPGKATSCFYLIALDGAHLLEPLWFACQQVTLEGTPCENPAENEI